MKNGHRTRLVKIINRDEFSPVSIDERTDDDIITSIDQLLRENVPLFLDYTIVGTSSEYDIQIGS